MSAVTEEGKTLVTLIPGDGIAPSASRAPHGS